MTTESGTTSSSPPVTLSERVVKFVLGRDLKDESVIQNVFKFSGESAGHDPAVAGRSTGQHALGKGKNKFRMYDRSLMDGLDEFLIRQLESETGSAEREASIPNCLTGRIGPETARFDIGSHFGSVVVSTDGLNLSAQSGFASLRANCGVFKGKWQYEVKLYSRGVMQLGWCTVHTKFTKEYGIGDSIDSYAYDGSRVRKWNVSSTRYGDTWEIGDTVTSCLDLDGEFGRLEYFRNGASLGVAFKDIPVGRGIVYFPGISLSHNENAIVNFGASPFKYPLPGYQGLECIKLEDRRDTMIIMKWLGAIVDFLRQENVVDFQEWEPRDGGRLTAEYRTVMVLANRIFDMLRGQLQSSFVVEHVFVPFLAKCLGLPELNESNDLVTIDYSRSDLVLEMAWTFMEEVEVHRVIESTFRVLLSIYRTNPLSPKYAEQVYGLNCLKGLVHHRKSRRYLLHHVLLDKTSKLFYFLQVRPLDKKVLTDVIPVDWWEGKTGQGSEDDKLNWIQACDVIRQQVKHLERGQVSLLKLLLTNDDGTDQRPSSRALFLRKFREYVRDFIRPASVIPKRIHKSVPVLFRFIQTVSELYVEEGGFDGSQNAFPTLPPSVFFDTSIDYAGLERIGGLSSHLYRVFHKEVAEALSIPDFNNQTNPGRRGQMPLGTPYPTANITMLNTMVAGTALEPLSIEVSDDGMSTGTSADLLQSAQEIVTGAAEAATSIGVSQGAFDPGSQQSAETVDEDDDDDENERPRVVTFGGTTAVVVPTFNPENRLPFALMNMITAVQAQARQIQQQQQRSEMMVDENVSTTSSVTDARSDDTVVMGGQGQGGHGQGHVFPLIDLRNLLAGHTPFGNPGRGNEPDVPAVALLGKQTGVMNVEASLRELMDDVIIILTCGVHDQFEKMAELRTTLEEYANSLSTVHAQLESQTGSFTAAERQELENSASVFMDKLKELSRQMAWVSSTVFNEENQMTLFQLLELVVTVLENGYHTDKLFSFVPAMYCTALFSLQWMLVNHMHPTIKLETLEEKGLSSLLVRVGSILSRLFGDPRVVLAETKDTVTQGLNMFFTNPKLLSALESMDGESIGLMVKTILRPYETRAWAQSNWMLVRMWQGDQGFGFNYQNSAASRNSFRARPVQDEFGIESNLPPSPSPILQSYVRAALLDNPDMANSFLHSLLNQLNWAFSEFVGLLQEIHSAATRHHERIIIETRQLKVCSTCYELSQSLFRVLEMVITIASELLSTDNESSQVLLQRLCMLIAQVLNRIASATGTFQQILYLDIPGLENITHYPLLSAVAGVMLALLKPEVATFTGTFSQGFPITRALLSEPSFQVSSLNFLLGQRQGQPESSNDVPIHFSLAHHVPLDITQTHMEALERTIQYLAQWEPIVAAELESENSLSNNEDDDDDTICTICYAAHKSATMKPCNHQVCKKCILHHLRVNNNDALCFFCKQQILQVVNREHDEDRIIFENHANQ